MNGRGGLVAGVQARACSWNPDRGVAWSPGWSSMVATKGRSGRQQEQQLASDGRVEAEPSGQAVRPAAAQELVHRLEVQAEGAAVGQEAVPGERGPSPGSNRPRDKARRPGGEENGAEAEVEQRGGIGEGGSKG